MKKLLWILVCVVLLLLSCTLVAAAFSGAPGYYCGGSEDQFAPVGNVEIVWDQDVSHKIDLNDGDMRDWEDAGYPVTYITPNNMISWVGGDQYDPAGGVPEGWSVYAFYVADPEYLYIGFYVTDPTVALVDNPWGYDGDAFHVVFDFEHILRDAYENEVIDDPKGIFYSFGPTERDAAPIQIMRQESDNDALLSEANGDGVKGSTALTDDGWCAEFALSWDLFYEDFMWKAYGQIESIEVSPEDPLELNCALYYLNREESRGTVTWAAGTLAEQEAGVQPDVTWMLEDMGIYAVLEYSSDLSFTCRDIEVIHPAEDETVTPDWEDEWTTIMPEDETVAPGWEDEWPTEVPGWEDEWPTEEPIWEGTYESEYRTGVTEQEMQTADGESSEAETKKKKKKDSDDDEDEDENVGSYLMSLDCASVITPMAAVFLTLSGIGCAVILKKRED